MNRLYAEGKNGKMLICVLEPGNIQRLKEAKPIEFSLNEGPYEKGLPAKLSIVILLSETPIADSREFEKWLAPEGVKIDKRSESKRPHCPECRSTIEQLAVWRNESAMALTFCAVCGCIFGMVPSEIAKGLKP